MAFRKRTAAPALTLDDVVASVPQPVELQNAELRVAELHERRAELLDKIRPITGQMLRATGHDVSRLEREVNRLHSEREAIEEATRSARIARDEITGPYRAAVAAAAEPLLKVHAERVLAAIAEVQAESEFFCDGGSRFPWLIPMPPIAPPALWSLKNFCRRLLGEAVIE